MYRKLADVELKSGEPLEVGVVEAPDAAFSGRIEPFLGHKGGHWQWHIQRCMKEPLDQLETRFYIGQINGEITNNIMTVEHEGVGILGHVFTTPTHRQKGACKGVMGHQMQDFRDRGGRALYLGTGYDSHAYHIYASFGFQSVIPRAGFMRYWVAPDFEGDYFSPGDMHVRSVKWQDWGKLTALTGIVGYDHLRSVDFGVYGPTNFEGGFIGFKNALETSERYLSANVLETEQGSLVGFATLVQDSRWHSGNYLLDIFMHPALWSQANLLLNSMEWPAGKIQCHADATSIAKAENLLEYGFAPDATLSKQISNGMTRLDVEVLQLWK